MKKLLFVAAFAVMGLTKVYSQENVVKVNPLAVLGGTDLVSYERVVGEKSSVVISAAYGGFKIGGVKYTSIGAGLQYRYYFADVLDGWYGAGVISYQNGNTKSDSVGFGDISSDEVEVGFNSFGGGVKAGHQWIWDSGFALDLNLGFSYKSFGYDDNESSILDLRGSGVFPTFGFALGYGW